MNKHKDIFIGLMETYRRNTNLDVDDISRANIKKYLEHAIKERLITTSEMKELKNAIR